MNRIVFEFDFLGSVKPYKESQKLSGQSDSNQNSYEKYIKLWFEKIAQPYQDIGSNLKVQKVGFDVKFVEKDYTVWLEIDSNLLENLLQIYTIYGWDGVLKAETNLKKFSRKFDETFKYFEQTKHILSLIILESIKSIEQIAIEFAQNKWKEAYNYLAKYDKQFTKIGFNVIQHRLIDEKKGERIFEIVKLYSAKLKIAKSYQEKIDERNRRDPPERRVAGGGGELYFELFAKPQRKVLEEMSRLVTELHKEFPPAVLVLDELVELDYNSGSTENQKKIDSINNRQNIENNIYNRIDRIKSEIKELDANKDYSIFNAGDFTKLLEYFNIGYIIDKKENDYKDNLNKLPGSLFDYLTSDEGENKLLSNLPLLNNLYDEANNVLGINRIILYQFKESLLIKMESKNQQNQIWHLALKVAAALAIISLLAIFPFGASLGAAAAPALIASLEAVGVISSTIFIITSIHDVFSALENAELFNRSAQDNFFKLGQENPKELLEISKQLSSSKALRIALIENGLLMILTLGAASKLKSVKIALELQDLTQNVNTVFTPLEK